MRNLIHPILLAILLPLSFPLMAQTGTNFSTSPSLMHFNYTEFSTSDTVLDRETGWLPGIQFHLNKALTKNWKTEFELTIYSGNVSYQGHTQNGNPHSTTTNEEIIRLGGNIQTPLTSQTNLIIGIKHNKWKRNIKDNDGIFGLLEIYRWWEISAGLELSFLKTETNFWRIEANLLRTLKPVIHVDLSRADYGKTDLNLGTDWGTRLKLSWMQEQTSNLQYSVGLFFEAWNFGRSNSKATTGGTYTATFYEPYSETRNLGIMLSITKTY